MSKQNDMKQNPFFRVLRNKNFLRIWGSQVFSQLTLNLINFVIILKIFQATGSTVAISLIWIFYIIPMIILGPLSGTIVDFLDRRRILFLTNVAESIIVLFYLLIQTKIWPIYAVIFFYSLVFQLYIPAEGAILPRIVPKQLLPVANSFFLFTIYGTMLGGFSLAGPLMRLVGGDGPFIIGSLFLLTAALAVYGLPKLNPKVHQQIDGPWEFWGEVKEGYLFIREEPAILFPLMLLAFAQIMITPLVILAPSYAINVLGLDLLDAGLALVLPFGVGALMGVQLAVWVLRRMRKKRLINFALIWATLCLFVLSLIVPFIQEWRLPLAVLSVFFLGLSYVSCIIPAQTLIQEKTPEEFRGRVFGVLGFVVNLAIILPLLVTAAVADILGVTWTIFMVAVAIGIIWFFSLREPYTYGSLIIKQD